MKRYTLCGLALLLLPLAASADSTTQPASFFTRARGTLIRVDDHALIVLLKTRSVKQKQDGITSVSIPIDEDAEIRINGRQQGFKDLKAGMIIDGVHLPATGHKPAHWFVTAISHGIDGTVVKVDATVLTMHATSGPDAGKDVEVETDGKTRITELSIDTNVGNIIKLSALATGARVKVFPETGTATIIYVLPS